jgi:hypothetical protein
MNLPKLAGPFVASTGRHRVPPFLVPLAATLFFACGPQESTDLEEALEDGANHPRVMAGGSRTFYVDGRNGSDSAAGTSPQPFRSLARGLSAMAAGDRLKVRTATYRELLKISKSGVTIEADTGHTPTIDGGYHPGLFGAAGYSDYCGKPLKADSLPSPTSTNQNRGDWPIAGASATLVSLKASGVTLRGFTVRNVAGRAIGVQADGCLVEDLRVDFTYGGAVYVLGTAASKVAGTRFRRVSITRSSVKFFDPSRDGPCSPQNGGPEMVQGTLQIKYGRDTIIEECTVAFNYAEGISAAKESTGTIIRKNIVHTNNHVHLYVVGGQDSQVYGNTVYYCQNLKEISRGDVPDGIVIGDETKTGTLPTVAGIWYNNLVVGMGRALNVRNNADTYRTVLKNAYIGYNTFVSNGDTRFAIQLNSAAGEPHSNTLVENNLVLGHPQAEGIARANAAMPTVRFRNNLWSTLPPVAFRSATDVVNAPGLLSPAASITGIYDVRSTALPNPHATTFDANNYRLTASSPAIGRGAEHRPVNNVVPPTVTVDLFEQPRTDFGAGRFYDIGADEF